MHFENNFIDLTLFDIKSYVGLYHGKELSFKQ